MVGGLGLLLCVAGFFANRAQFFQSYLFAFLYWGGFTLGGLCVLLMHHVVGGKWGATSRRFLEAQMRTLPLMFLFLVVLLVGMKDIYPWTHANLVAQNHFLQPQAALPERAVLPGAHCRCTSRSGCSGVCVSTKCPTSRTAPAIRRLRERMRAFSAPGLLIFTLTATFAMIDWVLSADTQYYSTVYGAMILIGDVLQTFALDHHRHDSGFTRRSLRRSHQRADSARPR